MSGYCKTESAAAALGEQERETHGIELFMTRYIKETLAMADLLTPSRLLESLEGNRRLTVRVIEAFGERDLFDYAPAGGLRPFADMVREIIGLEGAYVRGTATGEWIFPNAYEEVNTKAGLLAACAAVRDQTRAVWPRVTVEHLLWEGVDGFFDPTPVSNLHRLEYALENEIHHRGQAYIYLRMLGIEPPPFYER